MTANNGKGRIATSSTTSLFIVIVLHSSLLSVVALDQKNNAHHHHHHEQTSNLNIEEAESPGLLRKRKAIVSCAQSYSPNTIKYVAGQLVSNNGKNYICKDPPWDNWCNNADYEPGVGSTGYWGMAWRVSC